MDRSIQCEISQMKDLCMDVIVRLWPVLIHQNRQQKAILCKANIGENLGYAPRL